MEGNQYEGTPSDEMEGWSDRDFPSAFSHSWGNKGTSSGEGIATMLQILG